EEIGFQCDWVVLSTPLIPCRDGILLAQMLKIPLGPEGFLMEAHPKLRPVDAQTGGIFLAGTASGPKDIPESVVSGKAAAARASILTASKKVKAEAITAVVDHNLCIGCGLCVELCPYGAHRLEERKSVIVEALCKGCGVCGAACPQRAISMRHFKDDQILAAIKAAFVS
ncbi:MAG: 4Fe-4S dicluster domain-containing protein, partial [Nitrososphaeria archaeon]|nr:4Fe-4S dicluster domain-containing protein [Nitrososphaeria archaeon]NIN53233.1 4Fe-4S dicluster domain-containing protein [Nitrososphaeria archaeon]NIQ33687.1 4Fe-4S dicluster domain-containing protein [Nitrososphaeria archaeon]